MLVRDTVTTMCLELKRQAGAALVCGLRRGRSYVGVGERVLSWRTTSGILCTTTTSVMGHTPESDIGLKRSSCVACEARLYVSVVSV